MICVWYSNGTLEVNYTDSVFFSFINIIIYLLLCDLLESLGRLFQFRKKYAGSVWITLCANKKIKKINLHKMDNEKWDPKYAF